MSSEKTIQRKLEQGSAEWHAFRRKHHMASHAAIVMGKAPKYWTISTPQALDRYNAGAEPPEVDAKTQELFDAALAAEDWIRQCKSDEEFLDFQPAVFQRGEYAASLDGYEAGSHEWLEVKMARNASSRVWKDAARQEIPEHIYWQLVHQAYVLGPQAKCVHYIVLLRGSRGYGVRGDMIQRKALMKDWPRLQAAWEAFDRKMYEPAAGAAAAAKLYVDASKEMETAKAKMENARQVLVEHGDADYGIMRVTAYTDKGRINYRAAAEKAYEEDPFALEAFRSEPQKRYRMTLKDHKA